MRRRRGSATGPSSVVLLVGLVLALLGARDARADDPTLYVHYTMNCTFTITSDSGAAISVIPPGRYQVQVTSPQPFAEPDLSGATDPTLACGGSLSFHLTGPGVNIHTTLEDGDSAADQLQAMFQVGTYTALEDRRPTVARLVFTVASGAASTGGGTVPTSSSTTGKTTKPDVSNDLVGSALVATLSGGVSTAGKLTLTFRGKAVTSLKAGRYTISVLDETSRSGFSIQRLGKTATNVTSAKFIGRHTVDVTLRAGQWWYFSPSERKAYFIVHA
jgi:hypothetical protein